MKGKPKDGLIAESGLEKETKHTKVRGTHTSPFSKYILLAQMKFVNDHIHSYRYYNVTGSLLEPQGQDKPQRESRSAGGKAGEGTTLTKHIRDAGARAGVCPKC